MSADDLLKGASVAAQHAVSARTSLKMAPTDGSTRFNTIRIPLVPVACWRLNDPAFDFDSSFVAPSFRDEIGTLSGIVAANQACLAALFGHADPSGDDALNKTLGDRRAIAVYALLTRQPALWKDLYENPEVGDTWGTPAIQRMLASLTGRASDDDGNPVADPSTNPYYSGAIDGEYGPGTTAAVKAFQSDSGNAPDGIAGPLTRKALFGAYMDWLCTPDAPAGSSPAPTRFRMQPGDFLGGAGAQDGALPKMSLQSCGKLNPIVLLSNDEMSGADRSTRNTDDASNRRVVMFFFEPGTIVSPGAWPCPAVKEAGDACEAAFWPDGDARRKNGDAPRSYDATRDTMACRFYDRFARRSPCERPIVSTPPVAARPRSLASYRRSFPKPSLLPTLRELASRMKGDRTLRALVLGHSEATGDDDADYAVSLARAEAARALLCKNVEYLKKKFQGGGDPADAWGWEEVQWMLAAIRDPQGSPLYGGRMDAHRGDVTMAAVQAFKIVAETPAPFHRHVDDATLSAIVQQYVALVGADAPSAGRVRVLGGGSWHAPRSFGPGGVPLDGDYYETNDLPDFRRIEIFAFGGALSPATATCPAKRHDDCASYTRWCAQVVDSFEQPPEWDALITVVDADNIPIPGATVSLARVSDGETVTSASTSDSGVALVSAERDLYLVSTTCDGDTRGSLLDLRVPDMHGGARLRIGTSVRWPFDPDDPGPAPGVDPATIDGSGT